MKNKLLKIFTIVAFCAVFGCLTAASAQIKTGGYKTVPVTDAGVVAAADFAIQAKSEEEKIEYSLDAVETAETQVVAGTNYRLCMQILAPTADDDTEVIATFVKAVVFRSLKSEFSLKSWEEVEKCGK
jgi:hypothetical protein